MILDEARELIIAARAAKEARELASDRRLFETRAEELANAWRNLQPVRQANDAFRKARLPPGSRPPLDLQAVRAAVKSFEDRLDQSGSAFGDNEFATLLQLLTRSTDDAKRQLLARWREFCVDQAPSMNGDILNVLGSIQAFRATVTAAKHHRASILELREKLPTSVEDIEEVERHAREAHQAWNSITRNGIPDSVVTFLREATTGNGAPLALLTQEVRDWLTKQGLHNQLWVRLGAASNSVTSGRR